MNIKVLANQTLVDISLQGCGTIDNWFDVAILNGMGITDDLTPGNTVATPDALQTLASVVRLFGNVDLAPASGYDDAAVLGGIGYMQIGSSFKVY